MSKMLPPVVNEIAGMYKDAFRIAFDTWTNKNVVSCDACSGTGFTSEEKLTDYHRSEYSTFTNSCKKCKGEGRLTRIDEFFNIKCNYPHPNMESKKTTHVPWSEDPIELSSYLEGERGWFIIDDDS